MYTIEDVKNVVFTRVGRGYRTEEVDEFIEEVVRSMQAMKQNSDALMQKLGVLADKIEDYRSQEDSIHSALLTAQRMADQILNDAKTNADKLKEESEQKAAQLENEARQKASELTERAEQDYQTKLADTKHQATRVIAEAKDRSGRMLFEALEKSRAERAALEEMKRQTQGFKDQLVAMYQEQIALVQRLASQERLIPEPPASVQQEEPEQTVEPVVSEMVELSEAAPVESDDAQPEAEMPIEEVAPVLETAEPVEAETVPIQTEADRLLFEPVTAAAMDTAEQPAISKAPGTAPARFQIDADLEEERPSKFSNLKFGDDYDIADDEDYLEKEPRGFFKKRKK